MAIVYRSEFIEKYNNIDLDLRQESIAKQLKELGLTQADIHQLTRKDGHRLATVQGKLKEVSNAARNGKINAEEAYLYFEAKDANNSWACVDSGDTNNSNRFELDKRIRVLDRVFARQVSAIPSAFTGKIPKLAGLSLQQANEFFKQYPDARYDRPLASSQYDLNPSAAQASFHDQTLQTSKDCLSKLIKVGDQWENVLTHTRHEKDIRLIAYRNQWKSKQRDLLRFIQEGEWYLGTSHHNPGHRTITRQLMQDSAECTELLKFNISHVRNYIGVRDNRGKAGVVATDSPRSYALRNGAGHANKKDYPFLLWRVKFLGGVSHAEQRAYINNIRSWSMLCSKVTKFPANYNGNDNLMTYNMEKVVEFASHVLGALAGSQADLDKLQSKSEQVYCSESGMHLALNLGLNLPLNKANIEANFGISTWANIQSIVSESKDFWKNGKHQDNYGMGTDGYVKYSTQNRQVEMEEAPDWLLPLKNKLSDRNLAGNGLAFSPWNTADMIENFIKTIVPRKDKETWDVANTQAELLTWAKPSILHSMGFDQSNPAPRELIMLFDTLIAKIRKNYASYSEFRKAIAPELAMANKIVAPKAKGEGAFVPPHMVLSIKGDDNEMIALEPVGQCFHEDLLQKNL